jgi:hypothetical protein
MAQKINDLQGIRDTFAALPSLEKVHITEDGRHFFNEQHAKEANGFTSKTEEKKVKRTPNKVTYKSYPRDAKELELPAPTTAAA